MAPGLVADLLTPSDRVRDCVLPGQSEGRREDEAICLCGSTEWERESEL